MRTAGTWIIEENTNHYPFICDERGQVIAMLFLADGSLPYGRSYEETKANAKLIAAAPELLQAAESALIELSATYNFDLRQAPEWAQKLIKAKDKALT